MSYFTHNARLYYLSSLLVFTTCLYYNVTISWLWDFLLAITIFYIIYVVDFEIFYWQGKKRGYDGSHPLIRELRQLYNENVGPRKVIWHSCILLCMRHACILLLLVNCASCTTKTWVRVRSWPASSSSYDMHASAPHMTCMYPAPQMTCMYPPPHRSWPASSPFRA